MRFQASAALLLSFLIAASCAPPAEEPEPEAEEAVTAEADVEAINAVRDAFAVAYNAGDAAALVALLTDDVVLMPPNEPALVGSDAYQSWTEALFEQFTTELTIMSEELVVAGDWAFDRGVYTQTLTSTAGGDVIQDSGKYLVIFQRQADGAWKVARDIWNSDIPPAEM